MSNQDQSVAKEKAVHKTFLAQIGELEEIAKLALTERRSLSSMAGILVSEALLARKESGIAE